VVEDGAGGLSGVAVAVAVGVQVPADLHEAVGVRDPDEHHRPGGHAGLLHLDRPDAVGRLDLVPGLDLGARGVEVG
jgi:hypothetical protein